MNFNEKDNYGNYSHINVVKNNIIVWLLIILMKIILFWILTVKMKKKNLR